MSDSTTRFHQSLMGRMLLYVILPTGVILAFVIVLAAGRNFDHLRRISEDDFRTQVSLAALRIEMQNSGAVQSAKRMAEAQMAGMFGQRQASIDFARAVLKSSPSLTGAYFGYEPNADKQDADSLKSLPKGSMGDRGRFLPYWFRPVAKGGRAGVEVEVELEPLVDMEKEDNLYYRAVKENFAATRTPAAMVTEPYVYQGKMIVEQTYPIVVDKKFAGIAGVDRALSDLEAELRQLATENDVDLFLISSRGRFIAATTDPVDASTLSRRGLLMTRAVEETKYDELFSRLLDDVKPDQDWPVTVAEDPVDNQDCYYAVAPVPTGGWTVILRQPESAVVAAIWRELRVGVSVALVAFALIVALLLFATFRLSRRINLAVQAADRVARGDLTQAIDPGHCRDETGRLLRAIKTMMNNLNELVGEVKQAGIRLHSTATELAATGHQQEATAGSFGASTNEIAAAVKQVSATANELFQTMEEVTGVATGTATLATEGHASLQDMEGNMRGLDQATGSIAEKLAVINEKASNITGVVTTITKVADQTNLLSVNAAIEAEKAGEYGVGFLVVAREIRRLADQTAGATLDIEQMVQQMQSAVSAGVMEMDRFTDHVRRAVKDVGQISQQLGQIIERVNTNTASFERVNESMRSQSQGADQISEAMGQLTANARQTMEALKEYSQAVQDLQEAIAGLKSSIASFQLQS